MMGTNPDTEPDEPRIGSAVRSAIAGHPRAGVRRIILWIVALVALVVIGAVEAPLTAVSAVAFVTALVALLLLAMTDQLS